MHLLFSVFCIALVFLVLLMLSIIYTISGEYFKRRHSSKRRIREMLHSSRISDEEVAAAILALHLYRRESGEHDRESGIITIRR